MFFVLFAVVFCIHRSSSLEELKRFNKDHDDNDDGKVEYLMDDMILSKEQVNDLYTNTTTRRNAMVPHRIWPDKTVKVYITDDFNDEQKGKIRAGLDTLANKTCLKFPNAYGDEKAFVRIESKTKGCYAHVGYFGGRSTINLQIPGCLHERQIIHEMLHILGFYHMHTTSTRDEFVDIVWENIQPEVVNNFQKTNSDLLGTPYDFESIMHYWSTTFSSNGNKTITSKDGKWDHIMGQQQLSEGDVLRANKMYQC